MPAAKPNDESRSARIAKAAARDKRVGFVTLFIAYNFVIRKG